jgi:hypothetical protein
MGHTALAGELARAGNCGRAAPAAPRQLYQLPCALGNDWAYVYEATRIKPRRAAAIAWRSDGVQRIYHDQCILESARTRHSGDSAGQQRRIAAAGAIGSQ